MMKKEEWNKPGQFAGKKMRKEWTNRFWASASCQIYKSATTRKIADGRTFFSWFLSFWRACFCASWSLDIFNISQSSPVSHLHMRAISNREQSALWNIQRGGRAITEIGMRRAISAQIPYLSKKQRRKGETERKVIKGRANEQEEQGEGTESKLGRGGARRRTGNKGTKSEEKEQKGYKSDTCYKLPTTIERKRQDRVFALLGLFIFLPGYSQSLQVK